MFRYRFIPLLVFIVIFLNENGVFCARINNARKPPFTAMLVFPKEVMQQKEAVLYTLPTIVANNELPKKTRYLRMYVISSPLPYQQTQRDSIIEKYLNPRVNSNQLRAKRDAILRRLRPIYKTKRMKYGDQLVQASTRSSAITRKESMSTMVVFPDDMLAQPQPMLYALPTIVLNGDETDPRKTRYFYIYVLQSPNQQYMNEPMVMQQSVRTANSDRRNRKPAKAPISPTTPDYDTKGGVKRPTPPRRRFSFNTTPRPFVPRSPPASSEGKYRRINTGKTVTRSPRVNVATVPPFRFHRVYTSKTQQRKEDEPQQKHETDDPQQTKEDSQQKIEQQSQHRSPVKSGSPSNNTTDGFDDYDYNAGNETTSGNSTQAAPTSSNKNKPQSNSKTNEQVQQSKTNTEPDGVKGQTQQKEAEEQKKETKSPDSEPGKGEHQQKGYKSPSQANKEISKSSKTDEDSGKTNTPKDTQQKSEDDYDKPDTNPDGVKGIDQKKEPDPKGGPKSTTKKPDVKGGTKDEDTKTTPQSPPSKVGDRKSTETKGGVKGDSQQKQGIKSPSQANKEINKSSKTSDRSGKTNVPEDTQQKTRDDDDKPDTVPDGVKGVDQKKESDVKGGNKDTKGSTDSKDTKTTPQSPASKTSDRKNTETKGGVKGDTQKKEGILSPAQASKQKGKTSPPTKGQQKEDDQQKQTDYEDQQQHSEPPDDENTDIKGGKNSDTKGSTKNKDSKTNPQSSASKTSDRKNTETKGGVKGDTQQKEGIRSPVQASKQLSKTQGQQKEDEQKQMDYDDQQQQQHGPFGSPDDGNATHTSTDTTATTDSTTGMETTPIDGTSTTTADGTTTAMTTDTSTATTMTSESTTPDNDSSTTETSETDKTTQPSTDSTTSKSDDSTPISDATMTTSTDTTKTTTKSTDTTTQTSTETTATSTTAATTTEETTTPSKPETTTEFDTDSSLNGDKPDVVPAPSSLLPGTSTVNKPETAESFISTTAAKTTLPYGYQVDADRIADIFSK